LKGPKKFLIGESYSGVVDGVQEYGIFVKVYGFGSGLLHVKQIKKQGKEINAFSKGERISVNVINIRKDGKVEFALAE
jgi:predicted RNA-binding protein with RPS1 domain